MNVRVIDIKKQVNEITFKKSQILIAFNIYNKKIWLIDN